ncbi:hypothetical protein [Clostridium cochlearium]|uniref:hypothetical protein n=1 Tax=Clostridium cochlearium TaxID=1494 RepID=UPI001C0F27AF|nr:hypothetical protein [Clostridium cochlearium]MBU5269426.1 hypothetical protein [Clostridium cochlearium]
MLMATISLLIANLVTVIGTGVYIGMEGTIKKELKDHISKEFIAIPYRHIR